MKFKSLMNPSSISNIMTPEKSLDQDKEITQLLTAINKKFGVGALMLGFPKNESGTMKVTERIPTGSISLDLALGGGIPVGRFTELSGAYSVSKTTQAMHILRNAQNMGMSCAIIESEHGSITEDYLTHLGIDVERLIYSPSSGLEECTQILFDIQRSGKVQFAVWDSIEASPPTKEYEKEMDESMQMGLKPKINNMYFRKFMAGNNYLVRRGLQPFTLLGINQLRDSMSKYGDPEFTPGGRGKGFAASVEIRLRKSEWIKEGKGIDEKVVGQVVKFKIEKNKTYHRMMEGEFDFFLAENESGVKPLYVDNAKEIVAECSLRGLIDKKGAWYVVKETGFKCQGMRELINYMRPKKDLIAKLKGQIQEKFSR